MRSAWHWGWTFASTTALAIACGSGGDGGSPTGGTGGGPATGGSSAGGHAATGGTIVATGGSTVGGSTSAGGAAGQGDAGDTGKGGAEECAADIQEAKLTPANLLFLIDKSGSMNCNPPEGDPVLNARCADKPVQEDMSKPSKWEVASGALAEALDRLATRSNIAAGLTLFPIADQCDVSADPAVDIGKLDTEQRSSIADALEGVKPSGETPLAGATILSYQHLSEVIRAHELLGNTFVVLLTDGAETCKESELSKLVETDVPNARLFNIRTFVIGAPGSEQARGLLSRIAWEGGTASSSKCDHSGDQEDEGDCHFDMTKSENFADDLSAALDEISRTKVLACEFDVPRNSDGRGVDLHKVNVSFKPGSGETQKIKLDDQVSCDEANGWQYSDDRTKIVLCGDACDRVQADPEGEVRIALGCPTERIVR